MWQKKKLKMTLKHVILPTLVHNLRNLNLSHVIYEIGILNRLIRLAGEYMDPYLEDCK